jgi:hypothetical protein
VQLVLSLINLRIFRKFAIQKTVFLRMVEIIMFCHAYLTKQVTGWVMVIVDKNL